MLSRVREIQKIDFLTSPPLGNFHQEDPDLPRDPQNVTVDSWGLDAYDYQ